MPFIDRRRGHAIDGWGGPAGGSQERGKEACDRVQARWLLGLHRPALSAPVVANGDRPFPLHTHGITAYHPPPQIALREELGRGYAFIFLLIHDHWGQPHPVGGTRGRAHMHALGMAMRNGAAQRCPV